MDRIFEPRNSRIFHSDGIADAAPRFTTSVSGVEVPLGTTDISPLFQQISRGESLLDVKPAAQGRFFLLQLMSCEIWRYIFH
jgi:hypothetical protein